MEKKCQKVIVGLIFVCIYIAVFLFGSTSLWYIINHKWKPCGMIAIGHVPAMKKAGFWGKPKGGFIMEWQQGKQKLSAGG